MMRDIELIQEALGVGFFEYGPRLWMVGENEPLKRLLSGSCDSEFEKIIENYPEEALDERTRFYRLRVNPSRTVTECEFDAPPIGAQGSGRFDGLAFPVLYASPDLQTCIHELRVTVEDDIYAALLKPTSGLRVLNLSVVGRDSDATEFESIDIGLYMLFLSSNAGYEACRRIASWLSSKGFDGIIFPSYFSSIRTGEVPFETTFGLSNRTIPGYEGRENAKMIPNIALFGRPIADGRVQVVNMNRLVLQRVEYMTTFGPLI